MEIVVLSRASNTLVFELKGEGHTFCNALREALLRDPAVVFAAYRVDHPLISSPVFTVKTDGSKSPEDALREAAMRVIEFAKEFEEKALKALSG